MDLSKSIKRLFTKSKATDISQQFSPEAWTAITNGAKAINHDDYENGYDNITKITHGFAKIEPYLINDKGKRYESKHPILDAIYAPNKRKSAYEFREALILMNMVHDSWYLQVVHSGQRSNGNINPNSIQGFRFLENTMPYYNGTQYEFTLPTGGTVTDDEVLMFGDLDPYNISGVFGITGYSPAHAARRWAKLDDFMAEYQTGFFRNGAVPAGMFMITAATETQFNEIKNGIKRNHQGVGKNNNVMFSHRPIDPQTGKAVTQAAIEWVPFNVQNKDLALKDLLAAVNNKKDSTYGVPAEIRGHLSNSNYASVGVARQVFNEFTLEPATLKLWDKFTHELNRVTGGFGFAISFDMPKVEVADEAKARAEAKKTEIEAITALASTGYTFQSAAEAFKTGDYTKLVAEKKEPSQLPAKGEKPTEDQPDVQTSGEAKDTPEGEAKTKAVSKQIAARDIPNLYDGLDIDPDDLGCIMLKTEKLDVLKLVESAEADLAEDVNQDRSNVPGETTPHITLLYGLLDNGNTWKDKVDAVLKGWNADSATIDTVSYFELPDSYAVIAHIKKTTELIDANERLSLLPHVNTFSEYKPHMTLAYISKDADLGKWITTLGAAYNGKELKAKGIDYGDLPEDAKSKVVSKQISETERQTYERRLETVIRAQLNKQVEAVAGNIAQYSKAIDTTPATDDKIFSEEMMTVLLPLVEQYGVTEQAVGIALVVEGGLRTNDITPYTLTAEQRKAYEEYLIKVATGFNGDTSALIRQTLADGIEQNVSTSELQGRLRSLIEDDYRVSRLAISEVNRAKNRASVTAIENISKDTGYKIVKQWVHLGGGDEPCEFCRALIGTEVEVSESFLPVGAEIAGEDGGTYTNNFVSAHTADLHPHDHCTQIYKLVKS